MAGAPVTIEIKGKSYRVSPLRLKDIAECEQHLLARRRNPFDMVRAEIAQAPTPEDRQFLYRLAFDEARKENRVTPEEMSVWLDSPEGRVFTTWLALRREYPKEFGTLEQAEAMLDAHREEFLAERLRLAADQANGEDFLGKPTGPATGTTPGVEATGAAPANQPTGASSTATCPS